jgi:hypothetical protein
MYLYSYIPPNPYKGCSDRDLVTIDTSITVAITITVTIGMTVHTIFVGPVGLDICQRPLDVEEHISLLSPNSRESSRRHFPSAPASHSDPSLDINTRNSD